MFEFLMDMGNYADRVVGRDDYAWGFISTARVSDGSKPFETAVSHNKYHDDGKMTIVENYNTKDAATVGHAKWVARMAAKKLPAKLVDCNNAGVAQFGAELGMNFDQKRKAAK